MNYEIAIRASHKDWHPGSSSAGEAFTESEPSDLDVPEELQYQRVLVWSQGIEDSKNVNLDSESPYDSKSHS